PPPSCVPAPPAPYPYTLSLHDALPILTKANSTEFDPDTEQPVVALITEWQNHDGKVERRDENSDLGGTMRLGAQTCDVKPGTIRSEEHTSELQSRENLVCRLLLEKKKG